MIRPNIQAKVLEFTSASKANQRYASFDYCYNYFLTTEDLKKDIKKAAWRSDFIWQVGECSEAQAFCCKRAQPTIDYISSLDRSVWKIDVDDYSEQNIDTIIHIYNEIRGPFNRRSQSWSNIDNEGTSGCLWLCSGVWQFFYSSFQRHFWWRMRI